MARSREGTELRRMPVRFGIMKPPKNRTSHKKMITSTKLSRRGIGMAHMQAIIATKKHNFSARLLVYPPMKVVVINPPTKTPTVGPVIEAPE